MRKKGSISVFAALSFMLAASVLFTLLEGARVSGEKRILQSGTDAVMESYFAGYDKFLWENYRILARGAGACESFLDFQELGEIFDEESEGFMNPQNQVLGMRSVNYLRAKYTGMYIQRYALLTDGKGDVFQRLAASYMKKNIAKEAAAGMKNTYDRLKSLKAADIDHSITDAQEGMKKAKEENQEKSKQKKESGKKKTGKKKTGKKKKGKKKMLQAKKKSGAEKKDASEEKSQENPMDAVVSAQKTGILTLVLPKDAEISGKKVDLSKVVSKRKREQGKGLESKKKGAGDSFFVQLYYAGHFSDFISPNKKGGLEYEREYLLGGKDSDKKNLTSCINKILLSREAANLASLSMDPVKMEQVQASAAALAGATVNPLIIELVAAGIAAAWAYAESILDVRTLMAGGRIAPIKSAETWTSDFVHISQCISSDCKAIESKSGMCYSDFVNLLLYTGNSGKMAMRALDVMEASMRSMEGYQNFMADHMIVELDMCVEYDYSQNFLSPVVFYDWSGSRFRFQATGSYSYLKAGG